MLKDIIIYNGEDIIDYKYEVVNGELVISFNLDKELESVNVIYDINVYEKIKFNKLKVKKRFEDEVEVFLIGNKSVTFNLRVNNKFFVKSVYSFINRFSKKSELLDNLNLFKSLNAGKEYIEEIDSLINNIDTPESRVKGFDLSIEDDRVDLLLFTNKLYERIASKMKFKDLMLLVVAFDGAMRPPKVNNIVFNCLVTNAMCSKRYMNHLCVLANTYKHAGFDYKKIDEFVIREKKVNFFIKYISLDCINKEELINRLKTIGKKKFIEELKQSNELKEVIGEELFNTL